MSIPATTFDSSGDLIADRRFGYALDLAQRDDFAAAIELVDQALERAPGHPAFLSRKADFQEKAADMSGAAETLRALVARDPGDRFGARLRLSLISGDTLPSAPPLAYVEGLFDAYADRFDAHLVGKLDYRAPQLLLAAILHAAGEGVSFTRALDIGCGTGLMGQLLRDRVRYLEGFDLSRAMLDKARAKDVYDHLERADAAIARSGTAPADLLVAADVYAYCGDLAPLFAAARSAAAPGALFAFTVEANDSGAEFTLQPSLRYAHSEAYVRRTLATSGFIVESLGRAPLRLDRGAPIVGLVIVARAD